ncbi:MAG: phenylalanine--tRNA ligase subunit beta [archaeon]
MITEFSLFDLMRLMGNPEISKGELLDFFAMYGCPPEAPEGDLLKIEVFPNRPDLLMIEGAARALKGILGIERGLRLYSPIPAGNSAKIDPLVRDVRPFVSFAIVRGVAMDDQTVASIMQIQEKLHQTHGRKRRKVAIGIHDFDKIKFPITYTAVEPDSVSFIPLEMEFSLTCRKILERHPKGQEYAHLLEGKKLYPLIVDSSGQVLSMPPIINSRATRVTPATRNLLIDVTGTDEDAVQKACTIIATGLAERGAQIELVHSGDDVTPFLSPEKMKFSLSYARKLLGAELPADEIAGALERMRFGVGEIDSDTLEVSVPAYRTDILHQFDLVEDVAIGLGYPSFDPEIPALPSIGREHPVIARSNKAKDAMIGLGYQEVYTFAMTSAQKLFGKMNEPERPVAQVSNPKTEEFTLLRDELLPSLVAILELNKHNQYPQAIFEAGDVVVLDSEIDVNCRTERRLAAIFSGGTFETVKGQIERLLKQLGISQVSFSPSEKATFLPGRQAEISSEGAVLGHIGELHPQVLENHGIDQPSVGFEIALE